MPLVARDWDGNLKYSFPLQLAKISLQTDGVLLKESELSSDPAVFTQKGSAIGKLPRFRSNSGGYVRENASGNQMLINFCRLNRPYDIVSLREVVADSVDPDMLEDRIVMIGTVASSVKDNFITGAVKETLYSDQLGGQLTPNQLIYGV